MWYEAVPSMIAMGISVSIIELSPTIFNYLSWGCPMMRHSSSSLSQDFIRRDQRIAEENGVRWFAKHQYTFGFNSLDAPVKEKGNVDHYIEAERVLASK